MSMRQRNAFGIPMQVVSKASGSMRRDGLSQSSPASRKIPNPSNEFRIKRDESPRQVSCGIMLLGGLVVCAFAHSSLVDGLLKHHEPGFAFRKVALTLLGFLVIYCVLNTRDGVLVRPHPALWRLLHGWNLWYCLLATSILVMPVDEGRVLIQWCFPGVDLKKEPTQISHVQTGEADSMFGYDHLNCEINQKNVMNQLTSIWFLAHCLGWFAKMLILRDFKVCIVYSSVFELTELTLQFLVPEFQECWWDSLILDWLVANTLIGMGSGWMTLQLLDIGQLVWSSCEPQVGMFPRLLGLFMPSSWSKYEWNPGNDPVTMLLCAVIWIVMAVGEVNSFFLMSIFQLPRNHWFNPARQVLLCCCAVPAVEEWYEYTRHSRRHYLGNTKASQAAWDEYLSQYKGRQPRIGHFTWLLGITVCVETVCILKYSESRKWNARPGPDVWGPWVGFFCLFTVYFFARCYFFYWRATGSRALPNWIRYLKWASRVPLLWLLRLYAF